jgi:hypothetical protein
MQLLPGLLLRQEPIDIVLTVQQQQVERQAEQGDACCGTCDQQRMTEKLFA